MIFALDSLRRVTLDIQKPSGRCSPRNNQSAAASASSPCESFERNDLHYPRMGLHISSNKKLMIAWAFCLDGNRVNVGLGKMSDNGREGWSHFGEVMCNQPRSNLMLQALASA